MCRDPQEWQHFQKVLFCLMAEARLRVAACVCSQGKLKTYTKVRQQSSHSFLVLVLNELFSIISALLSSYCLCTMEGWKEILAMISNTDYCFRETKGSFGQSSEGSKCCT